MTSGIEFGGVGGRATRGGDPAAARFEEGNFKTIGSPGFPWTFSHSLLSSVLLSPLIDDVASSLGFG